MSNLTDAYACAQKHLMRSFSILLTISITVIIGSSGCSGPSLDELLQQSEQAVQSNDYRAAIILLKNAAQAHPDNALVRWRLGELLLALQDGATAEKEFRRAEQLGLGINATHPALAEALTLQGKREEVTDLPTQGLNPQAEATVLAYKAQAYNALNNSVDAKNVLAQALSRDSDSADVVFARAVLALADRDFGLATKAINEVEKIDPAYRYAPSVRGAIALQQNDFLAAETAFSIALERRSNWWEDLLNRGRSRYHQNKFDAALEDAHALRTRLPGNAEVQLFLSQVLLKKNDKTGAKEALEISYNIDPTNFLTNYLLARIELADGNRNRGEDLARAAYNLSPSFVPGRKLLAAIFLSGNQGGDAESLIKPVVEALPSDFDAKRLLLKSLLQQKRFHEAALLGQQIEQHRPNSIDNKLDTAIALVRSEELESGLKMLQEAIEKEPKNLEVASMLVATLTEHRSAEHTLRVVDRLARNAPNSINLRLLQAQTYLSFGRDSDAAAILDHVLQLDPGNVAAVKAYLLATQKTGDTAIAAARVDSALNELPRNTDLLLLRAQIARDEQDWPMLVQSLEQAIRVDQANHAAAGILAGYYLDVEKDYERALDTLVGVDDSDHPIVQDVLARAYFRAGDFDQSLIANERLSKLAPADVNVQMRLVALHEITGNVGKMRDALNSVINLAPDNDSANIAHARLLSMEGRNEEATRVLETVQLPEEDPEILRTKIQIALASGKSKEAIKLAEKLWWHQKDLPSLLGLSRIYAITGDNQLAIALLESWLRDHPRDIGAMMDLAAHYRKAGRITDNQAVLKRILTIDPGNSPAMNNLAWELRDSNTQQALDYARKAHQIEPNSLDILDTLTEVLTHNRSYDEAIRYASKAIDISDNPAPILLRRAEIYVLAGNLDLASMDLQAIVTSDLPESYQLRKNKLTDSLVEQLNKSE